MTQDELLAHIKKLLEANNAVIRHAIQTAKTAVINAVRKAEDEIIETLKNTTGELATEQDRLRKQVEDHLGLPHAH